jgi:hypothetical protein
MAISTVDCSQAPRMKRLVRTHLHKRINSRFDGLPRLRSMASTTPDDKSHHKPGGGGFVNPWSSFRDVTLWGFMQYRRKYWDHERSKVPPQNELYVKVLEEKKMAWEKIRNPPKDKIQATWCHPQRTSAANAIGSAMRRSWFKWMESTSSPTPYGLIGMSHR